MRKRAFWFWTLLDVYNMAKVEIMGDGIMGWECLIFKLVHLLLRLGHDFLLRSNLEVHSHTWHYSSTAPLRHIL